MARDFPFRPQVNEWNFANREDVLSHLQQKETQRLQKIAAMQQQRVLELQQSISSTPAISPYSKSLTFDQPAHLRLYSLASRPPPPEEERPRSVGRMTTADFAKVFLRSRILSSLISHNFLVIFTSPPYIPYFTSSSRV